MHHTNDRITHTTAFVTPVVEHWLEKKIAQWVRNCTKLNAFTTELHLTPVPVCGTSDIKPVTKIVFVQTMVSYKKTEQDVAQR